MSSIETYFTANTSVTNSTLKHKKISLQERMTDFTLFSSHRVLAFSNSFDKVG